MKTIASGELKFRLPCGYDDAGTEFDNDLHYGNHSGVGMTIVFSLVGFFAGMAALKEFSLKRCLSLFLMAVALFPCVSSADDLIQLQSLAFNVDPDDDALAPTHGQTDDPPESLLDRQLQESENLQLSVIYDVIPVLCFCSFVFLPFVSRDLQYLPSHSGRSPPQVQVSAR